MTFEEWWKNNSRVKAARENCLKLTLGGAKDIVREAWKAAQPEWRPIETAPMGKRVLVKRFGHEPEIRRIVRDAEGDIVAIRDCGRRVLISVFDAYMELPKQIIQWVPLPEPPAAKKK